MSSASARSLSIVGDHVVDAHDAAPSSVEGRKVLIYLLRRRCRLPLHQRVDGEVGRVAHAQHLLANPPLCAQHAVEGLQADVAAVHS